MIITTKIINIKIEIIIVNNYNNNNYNKNYYNNKKKNNIAVEIPDNQPQQQDLQQNQQNQVNYMNNQNQMNNAFANNQINIRNNEYYQFIHAKMMSNFQADLMRMNYFANMEHLNSDLNSPGVYVPMTDSGIVDVIEKYFSEKNLNKDLNLRKNMDEETGYVPIEFILNLKKIQSMQLTEERIYELFQKVGSDIIEVVIDDNKMFLKPKNYENIKKELKTIEEIEQNCKPKNTNNNQPPQPNMNMGMPPMYFYPVPPMMMYNPMMMASQQNMKNQNMMQNQNPNQNNNEEQEENNK